MSDLSSPHPSAPPTEFDVPIDPPRWPKVVGIVSIVWGSVGLLCGMCGAGSILFMSTFTAGAEQQLGPMPDEMKPSMAQMAMSVLSIPLAIALIVAGVLTLGRKPLGRTLHLGWAGAAILLTIVATGVGIVQALAQLEWAKANPTSPWAKNANPAAAVAMIVFGVVMGAAWPIFAIVWFGILKKRPELGRLGGDDLPAA